MDENKSFLLILTVILVFTYNFMQNLHFKPEQIFLALVLVGGILWLLAEPIKKTLRENYERKSAGISNSLKQYENLNSSLLWTITVIAAVFISSPIIALIVPNFPNYAGIQTNNSLAPTPTQKHTDNTPVQIGNSSLDYSNLPINPLSEYNYKSKKEIYEIRKKHVMNSIFTSPKYEPNEEIFGQIQDGKPWYGVQTFLCKNGEVTKGVSYRSKFINNPTALIDVSNDIAYKYSSGNTECRDTKLWTLLVSKLSYHPKENIIIATYNADKTFLEKTLQNWQPILDFDALNARDFGYYYGYAEKYNNLEFNNRENISTGIYQFRDFIHTGQSCKVDGECNNQSPWQKELDFYLTGLPATITFKLWKNQPISKFAPADIYYTIIIKDKDTK